MNKLRVAHCLVAVAAAFAVPAYAIGSQTTDAEFEGSVANTCVIEPLQSGSGNNVSLEPGASSTAATVTFSGFADNGTAMFVPGSGINLSFDGYCNYPHTLRVQTTNGSLQHQTGANDPVAGSGTFIDEVFYVVNVFGWDGVFVTLDADGTAGAKSPNGTVNGAYQGSANLTISLTNPGTDPLLSGQWSDTLVLQIGQPL